MLKTPGFLGKSDDTSRYPANKPATPAMQPIPAAGTSSSAAPAAATASTSAKPADTAAKPAAEASIGNRLIVGPDVKLRGAEIEDCDTLIVEGRVEATLDSHIIRVAEQGSFSGKVSVDTAEIHGRFDGELTTRGQLFIHSTGHVSGKIRYGKILIEEGGQISGDVQSATSESNLFDANKSKPLISTSMN